MATESLLPLFYDGSAVPDDVDLTQLLNQNALLQDDEFLSGLLENENAHSHDFLTTLMGTTTDLNTASPSSSFGPEYFASAACAPAGSPVSSTGYLSDHSALGLSSPVGSHLSYSDPASSPAQQEEGQAQLDDWISNNLGHGDVSIDLESGATLPDEATNSKSSDLKTGTVRLTEEEKKMLAEEGIVLPTNMALTKAEQKHLKRIRRKIKNKLSAQESRKRKKDYVDGLEQRVQKCTEINRTLEGKVRGLESENRSLLSQLKKLQAMVARAPVQTSAFVMVMVFSFSIFFVPGMRPSSFTGSSLHSPVPSRTLLFTETDEFGNIIDPETGLIVSEVGGQSPPVPPLGTSVPRHGTSGAQQADRRTVG
ncbi:hypothetical protein EMCRGX_G022217 [Ephydatia muelleri]